ncbi:MAG: hypothetical protein ABDH37_03900 [Candidatus Hydrothermales bacterium]
MKEKIDFYILKHPLVLFTLLDVPDKIGVILDVFERISNSGIALPYILTSPSSRGKSTITVLVPPYLKEEARKIFNDILESLEWGFLRSFENVALVSFYGKNLMEAKGVMAGLLNIFITNKIKIIATSTAMNYINFIIPGEMLDNLKECLIDELNMEPSDVP